MRLSHGTTYRKEEVMARRKGFHSIAVDGETKARLKKHCMETGKVMARVLNRAIKEYMDKIEKR